jgi:hypothetical protein
MFTADNTIFQTVIVLFQVKKHNPYLSKTDITTILSFLLHTMCAAKQTLPSFFYQKAY